MGTSKSRSLGELSTLLEEDEPCSSALPARVMLEGIPERAAVAADTAVPRLPSASGCKERSENMAADHGGVSVVSCRFRARIFLAPQYATLLGSARVVSANRAFDGHWECRKKSTRNRSAESSRSYVRCMSLLHVYVYIYVYILLFPVSGTSEEKREGHSSISRDPTADSLGRAKSWPLSQEALRRHNASIVMGRAVEVPLTSPFDASLGSSEESWVRLYFLQHGSRY